MTNKQKNHHKSEEATPIKIPKYNFQVPISNWLESDVAEHVRHSMEIHTYVISYKFRNFIFIHKWIWMLTEYVPSSRAIIQTEEYFILISHLIVSINCINCVLLYSMSLFNFNFIAQAKGLITVISATTKSAFCISFLVWENIESIKSFVVFHWNIHSFIISSIRYTFKPFRIHKTDQKLIKIKWKRRIRDYSVNRRQRVANRELAIDLVFSNTDFK